MNARRAVALGLANALLAGEWAPDAMSRRVRSALGARSAWSALLVRDALAKFGEAPRDGRDELADFVEAHRSFLKAWARLPRRPRIVRWWIDEPAMGPSPWDVPALPTTAELARYFDLDVQGLDWLADRRGLGRFAADSRLRNYVYTWWRKPTGGVRVLEAPKSKLKALQRGILHDILDRIPAHPAAHGFCPGRSTVSFAAPHAGREVVIRCDLEDFFSSVSSARVVGIFRTAGYPEPVALTLAAACTNRLPSAVWRDVPRPTEPSAIDSHWRQGRRLSVPHLPQGAPTSPALANLAAYRLDVRLAGLARSLGLAYTRYADDLAFSGAARATGALLADVRAIARDEGFALREDKTRVRAAGARQLLGGWVVNRLPNVPRDELDRLEAILTNCVRRGPSGENRDGHPDFRAHLRGRIAWVKSARPDRAAALERLLSSICWD